MFKQWKVNFMVQFSFNQRKRSFGNWKSHTVQYYQTCQASKFTHFFTHSRITPAFLEIDDFHSFLVSVPSFFSDFLHFLFFFQVFLQLYFCDIWLIITNIQTTSCLTMCYDFECRLGTSYCNCIFIDWIVNTCYLVLLLDQNGCCHNLFTPKNTRSAKE